MNLSKNDDATILALFGKPRISKGGKNTISVAYIDFRIIEVSTDSFKPNKILDPMTLTPKEKNKITSEATQLAKQHLERTKYCLETGTGSLDGGIRKELTILMKQKRVKAVAHNLGTWFIFQLRKK